MAIFAKPIDSVSRRKLQSLAAQSGNSTLLIKQTEKGFNLSGTLRNGVRYDGYFLASSYRDARTALECLLA